MIDLEWTEFEEEAFDSMSESEQTWVIREWFTEQQLDDEIDILNK